MSTDNKSLKKILCECEGDSCISNISEEQLKELKKLRDELKTNGKKIERLVNGSGRAVIE